MKPTLFSRLKSSYQFFKHGWRYYEPRQTKKSIPYVFPNWVIGQPQWHLIDYESYAQEGFNENAIVYAALMYIYRASQAVPLRAYSGTFDKSDILKADHELQKLCMRPNRWQTWQAFQGLAEIYLNLAGNCYIYIDRQPDKTIPRALYLLRPDRVYLIPGRGERDIIGYYHLPEGKGLMDGVPYQAKDIIHIKSPNPLDRYEGLGEGLSSLSPAARSIDVDNALTKFLKLFVDNGVMPLGLLSFDVPMDSADMIAARERFKEIYGGYENWATPAVLDQGGKWQQIGATLKDLDMGVLDARNESRSVSVFGVPLTLIETRPQLVQSTYDNKATDRKMFWEDKMKPEILGFQAEYQYYLQGDRGEFVMFDFSEVPALTMTAQEKGEQTRQAFVSGGITRNEYRSVIGQNPANDGDVYLIPSNVIEQPIRDKLLLPEPEPEQQETQVGMPEAEEEAEEVIPGKSIKSMVLTSEQKAELWQKNDDFATGQEAEFGKAAVKAFEDDKRNILALLSKKKKRALEEKASINWAGFGVSVTAWLLGNTGAETWQSAFIGPMTILMTAKVESLNNEFNQSYPTAKLLKQDWFNEYTIKFAKPINDTTNETIKRMIEQASDEGWSIPMMQKRILLMFDQWMTGNISPEEFAWYKERMPDYRRELIARTETLKASNHVSYELYKSWGNTKGREWLSTYDNRTRPDHVEANGQIALWGQKFNIGGYEMDYPGDMSAPAEQVCNCRCTIIPIFP